MDLEAFKNLTTGIQSLVIAGATIVAGVWAIYTFNALGTVSRAAAERAELERRSRQEPVLQIDLSARLASDASTSGLVLVSAILKNDGARTLEVKFSPQPILLSKVSIEGGKARFSKPSAGSAHVRLANNEQPSQYEQRFLRTGQSRAIPLVVRAPGSGLYLIQFTTIYSGVELKADSTIATNDAEIEAAAQIFVEVP